MAQSEVHVMHRHAGPRRVLDSTTAKQPKQIQAASEEFKEQLRSNGNVLGVDMEWVPDRCIQHDHKVALMQLAVGDVVWLIRTCQIPLPGFVREVLLDETVVKVVAAFDSADRQKLTSSFGINVNDDPELIGFLDISTLAKKCGFSGFGVKRLSQKYGFRIRKSPKVSCSNWAIETLSEIQLQYACDDAYFTLLVAEQLLKEEAVTACPSELRSRALTGCCVALPNALASLKADDSSEHDVAVDFLLQEIRGAMESNGLRSISIAELGGLRDSDGTNFGKRAQFLGISLGKKFLQEQHAYFAVTTRNNEIYVRARSVFERTPPSDEDLSFPWAKEPQQALQCWLSKIKREQPCIIGNHNAEEISDAQLQSRLRLLGRELEARGETAAAIAAAGLATIAGLRQANFAIADSGGTAPSSPRQSADEFQTFDPSLTIVAHKLPKDWGEEQLINESEASLGSVVDSVFLPPCKGGPLNRGFAFLVLRDPIAAKKALATPETTWGGASVSLSAYKPP